MGCISAGDLPVSELLTEDSETANREEGKHLTAKAGSYKNSRTMVQALYSYPCQNTPADLLLCCYCVNTFLYGNVLIS